MTERNEKVMEKAEEYLKGWLRRRGGLGAIRSSDLATLIHNSLLAGWSDKALDWNDHDSIPVAVGSLHWQEEFRKVGGNAVFSVVSEYSAKSIIGLREGKVWVTDGKNVNAMDAETPVVRVPICDDY